MRILLGPDLIAPESQSAPKREYRKPAPFCWTSTVDSCGWQLDLVLRIVTHLVFSFLGHLAIASGREGLYSVSDEGTRTEARGSPSLARAASDALMPHCKTRDGIACNDSYILIQAILLSQLGIPSFPPILFSCPFSRVGVTYPKRVVSWRDGFHTVPVCPHSYMKWVRIYPSLRHCLGPTTSTRQKRARQRTNGLPKLLFRYEFRNRTCKPHSIRS